MFVSEYLFDWLLNESVFLCGKKMITFLMKTKIGIETRLEANQSKSSSLKEIPANMATGET